MGQLGHADSFRDLVVYQKARKIAQEVFRLSRSFPRDESYSLVDQVRRCSRSIGAQIAEAWGKRRYQKHFECKLSDADAEQLETQHWIDTALDCGYLTHEQHKDLLDQLGEVGRMLSSMITKSDQFCGAIDH
jgi:four helix bundle protein